MAGIFFFVVIGFGLPILVGQLAKLIVCAILELVVGQAWKRIPNTALDFLAGLFAAVFAGLFSNWLGYSFTFLTVLWLSIVGTAWLASRREMLGALAQDAGLVAGFLLWISL